MTVRETDGGRRAELFVRSLVMAGSRKQQVAVIDRLDGLAATGRIAEYDVHVWGSELPASAVEARTEAGAAALDRLAIFRAWARRNDVSLDSTFECREVDAALTGEHFRSIVLPTFLLAEYRDGELDCVTPHRTDDRVYTVADRLERLARGTADEYEPVERHERAGQSRSPVEVEPEPVASE